MKRLWLTVNRQCNIRCEWCYAEGTNYSSQQEMSLSFAKKLIDTVSSEDLQNIIILGGEPTLWKPLPELLHWIAKDSGLNIVPTIVTNGIRFANDDFFSSMEDCQFKIGLSMKSANHQQHKQLTKTNTFDKVITAIQRLAVRDIPFGVSVTVNSKLVDSLEEITEVVFKNGAKNISFEMCAPSFNEAGEPDNDYIIHPALLANKIVASYGSVCEISGGMVSCQMSVPFCLFSEGFIETLKKRNQLISGCHVMERDGVILDPDGNILLCNCLHHVPLGSYGTDFSSKNSFIKWWNHEDVVSCNKELLRYPIKKCTGCKDYEHCCGGCPLQWFSFDPGNVL